MNEVCSDNRFEIIEQAKKQLCKATNIEDSPTEWAVIDSVLFRMWQMGWLPGCEQAELTCKMEMVSEDDEGNELYSSAPYYRHYRCSNCRNIAEHYKHDWWNYCPECRAKVIDYV